MLLNPSPSSKEKCASLDGVCKIMFIFAASEGRNPRVKNAFLALSCTKKSPNLSRGMETKIYAHSVLYMYAYSPALCFAKCIQTAWGICSQFISTAVFGDTIRTMSATSLYAFLVSVSQTHYLR